MNTKTFGSERFVYVGTARNHRDIHTLSWKLRKENCIYRFVFNNGTWQCYKKRKSKIRVKT